jgi:radical SAM superfamily enzyme YgiQ (UPF0313 family)
MDGDQVIWPQAAMLPVGPLAIATSLLERGHEVSFRDFVFADTVPSKIDASSYDAVLVACHTLRNVPTAQRVIRSLRGARHVVVGGNVCAELGIRDFRAVGMSVDAVVRGYGHGMVREIEARCTGDLVCASAPSRMACPDIALLDEESRTRYIERSGRRYPIIGPGGFGCAWACNYCTAKMLSKRVERDWSDVVDEVRSARRWGYEELWCVDNIVLVDPDLALEFDAVVARAGMSWLGMTRAETVRSCRQLSRFQRLTDIALGVEANSRQLKSLNRGERADNERVLRDAFQALHDAGISSTAFVMLDLPGSRDEDYWALLDLLGYVKPGNVSWSFFNPPAPEALRQRLDLSRAGFYRWPLGFAAIPDQRVVQHAMVITGTWWMNWAPRSFFTERDQFGVSFDDGEIAQRMGARSSIGDLWDVWEYRSGLHARRDFHRRRVASRGGADIGPP